MNRKPNFLNVMVSVLVGMTLLISAAQPNLVSASTKFWDGEGIRTSVHPQTGKLSFLGADPSSPIRVDTAMRADQTAESRGIAILDVYGRQFGLKNPQEELRILSSHDTEGRGTTKYQQLYQGIPVMAGELIVNTNAQGALLSINGEVSPDLDISITPSIDSSRARNIALREIANAYGLSTSEVSASEPELWVYDARLMNGEDTTPAHLVWRMEITSDNAPLRELVLVNAESGKISLHFNQIDTAWMGNFSNSEKDENPFIWPKLTSGIRTDENDVKLAPTLPARYVDHASGVDAGNCGDSVNPCQSIQYAIMMAAAQDTIAVTGGTYKFVNVPGSGNEETPGQVTPRKVVLLSKRVNLSGGWDNTFTNQTGMTIVDGEHVRYGVFVSTAPAATTQIDHFMAINSTAGTYIFSGTVSIKNSSMHHNDGNGLWNDGGSMTLENVTVSKNSGSGISNNGVATITNSTITYNNGIGLYKVGGTVTIRNTILAFNAASAENYDCSGTIISGGHNHIRRKTSACVISPVAGDDFTLNKNPKLSEFLASRGYQPLMSDSPAIDVGDPALCPVLDQRGMGRVNVCDIGAYEFTTPGAASVVSVETGANQRTRVEGIYAEPLVVSVLDANGSPVVGESVTITAPASGPSVVFQGSGSNSEDSLTTNASGMVTTSLMTANSEFGAFTVVADAGPVGTVDISLENLPWKWYVATTGSDSNACNSPAAPCATISAAVNKANSEDTVFVAAGVYTGSGYDLLLLEKSITLSGGWNTGFDTREGYSTLDCELERAGIFISGPRIVNISYFEIKNAKGSGLRIYQGTVTIVNSSIHDNVYEGGGGGGIDVMSGTVIVRNSTISNNVAQSGGGIFSSSATTKVLLDFVTVSNNHSYDNGGGVYKSGDQNFKIKNSILAGNTSAGEGPDCYLYGTTEVVSQGYNIIENTCGSALATDKFNTDPKLGVFLPVQGYHPLLPNSPAIDNSSDTCGGIDQRGITRIDQDNKGIVGVVCDAGAFEYIKNDGAVDSLWVVNGDSQRTPPGKSYLLPLSVVVLDNQGNPVLNAVVNFTAPASGPSLTFLAGGSSEGPLSTPGSGVVTSSLPTANSESGTFTVEASSGIFTASFSLTNVAWYVSSISGNDSNTCLTPSDPCITLPAALQKSVDGDVIYVADGTYTGLGENVLVIDKPISISGGWNLAFDSQIGYSTIDGQKARRGILIRNDNFSTPIQVNIDHFIILNGYSYLNGNSSYGGGIANEYESLYLSNSILEFNSSNRGGGLYSSGKSILNHVMVQNNKSSIGGGGIFSESSLAIESSVVSGNISDGNGGGIENHSGLTVSNTTIAQNASLTMEGGGIFIYTDQQSVFNNVTITENYAAEYGGGISNGRPSNYAPYPNLYNVIIAGNDASTNLGNDCTGKFVVKFTLIQDSLGCLIASGVGNLLNVDPMLLGFLPTEGYSPLIIASPAIGKGNGGVPGSGGLTCEANDQRGVARNDCDMGSYEYAAPGSPAKIVPLTNNLRTPPNSTFPPLQVLVLDIAGSPSSADAVVRFTAPAGGASGLFANLSNTTTASVTAAGVATASAFTANNELGSYKVTVVGTEAYAGLASTELDLSNFAWYVSPTGSDSNDCTSPASPCQSPNAAIAKALPRDTIYLSEGSYYKTPDLYNSIIRIPLSVKLVGGWDPTFTMPGKPSIIDGERTHSGILAFADDVIIERVVIKNFGFSQVGINIARGSAIVNRVSVMDGYGVGISNSESALTIRNTTVSHNRGGVSNVDGTVMVENSTITNNDIFPEIGGGGLSNTNGTITIKNTIVSGNNSLESPDCFSQGTGGIVSAGNNIIGSTQGCSITAKLGDKFNVDPDLSPLLPMGYQPIKSSSPARNAGNPATCTTEDQRGVARTSDPKCDIGAYEYKNAGTPVAVVAVRPEIRRVPIHTALISPLLVAIVDAFGSPVAGVPVDLVAPASGPSGSFVSNGLSSESLVTDFNGYVSSSTYTANDVWGDYQIIASSSIVAASSEFYLHNGAWLIAPTGKDVNGCLSVSAVCKSIEGVLAKKEFNQGEVIWIAGGNYLGGNLPPLRTDFSIVGGWNQTFSGLGGATTYKGGFFSTSGIVKYSNIVFTSGANIRNAGNLVIENSSVYRTSLGIENIGSGNLTLMNVTVSGNGTYYPPIRNVGGHIMIINSTITGNKAQFTGGIRNEVGISGTVTLLNSILAGNTAVNPVDYASDDCQGDFISLGHNIIGTIGSQSGGIYDCRANWLDSDLYGDNADPVLATDIMAPVPVQDALTGQWYHALKLNGPAIEAGNEALPGGGGNACPATDQLGVPRPQGARCDIGAIEYQFASNPPDPKIATYSAGSGTNLPGALVCSGNTAACSSSDTKIKNVHQFAFSAYSQYLTWHGRKSIDGDGSQVMSAVHYGSNYSDSFWNGFMLVFGDGQGFALADDIVAHEFTHGVTQYESNLFPWYQSGAISESFADLWGEAVDQTNGLGNDAASVKWLIGEDMGSSGAIRNMKTPPDFKDPDSMLSSLYCKSGPCVDDNGGIHTNSGVNNKAAYLMVDGGTFGGRTVTALGLPKTLAIYYEAQTNLLTSGSDYLDLHNALYQACLNLVGTKGIALANCTEVRDATLAVKMDKSPVANFNPDVPYCPTGTLPATSDLFFDNFETGTDGWTMGSVVGVSAWSMSGNNAKSGVASLWADDSYAKSDSFAATGKIVLPAGAKVYLHFSHSFGFDALGASNYDGGVLEYTINNGTTWVDAKSLFDVGQGYKGSIRSGYGNHLAGRNAFVGDSHGYVDSRYSLSSLAGKTIQLRWRMGTSSKDYKAGWHVDNVKVYRCVSIPAVPILSAPIDEATFTDTTPTFNWSDSKPDLHHYELQIATNQAFTTNVKKYNDIVVSQYTLTTALTPNTYYWRVRAYNAAGKFSAWSTVWRFTLQ